MHFRIYRFDPDKDAKPYMKDYDVQLEPSDRMLLDALVRIKAIDDTLSLRRSCREGVCGSDAMNINGKNGLACITRVADLKQPIELRPLPGLPPSHGRFQSRRPLAPARQRRRVPRRAAPATRCARARARRLQYTAR